MTISNELLKLREWHNQKSITTVNRKKKENHANYAALIGRSIEEIDNRRIKTFSDLREVQNKYEHVDSDVTDLCYELLGRRNEIKELKTCIEDIEDDYKTARERIAELEKENSTLSRRYDELAAEIKKLIAPKE